MQLVSAQDGKLVRLQEWESPGVAARGSWTGLAALDALLPPGGLRHGAIHELLHHPHHPQPRMAACAIADWRTSCESRDARCERPDISQIANRNAQLRHSSSSDTRHSTFDTPPTPFGNQRSDIGNPPGHLIWFDPDHTLYPPALAALGVDLSRLYLVRPRTHDERLWALAECLRCNAVKAVVCAADRLSRVEARKLQLAAEQGGGVGILLRPLNQNAGIYAAATRWLVEPARGERSLQRWTLRLLHGHGGRIGSVAYLEHCRETHLLRSADQLPDRSRQAQAVAG